MAQGITRGKTWWRKCFQQIYPQSGTTVGAFCKQEQIALSTFYTWRKRLSAEEKSAKAEDNLLTSSNKEHLFIPVRVDNKTNRSDFAQHAVKNHTNKLEIILANGNIVRLQASPSQILEILDLLV